MRQAADAKTLALELLPSGVLVADGTGRVLAANNAARVLLGLEEAEGQTTVCYEGQPVALADLVRDQAL